MKLVHISLAALVLVLAVAALHPGCSTNQPRPVASTWPGPDKAVIYIYRNEAPSKAHAAFQPEMMIDGQVVCKLAPNEYYAHVCSPGRVEVYAEVRLKTADWSKTHSCTIPIEVRPGGEYYVRMAVPLGLTSGRAVLKLVGIWRGRTDVKYCTHVAR